MKAKDGHCKRKGTKSISRSKKAGIKFPIGKIAHFLKVGMYSKYVSAKASGVLELAGNEVRYKKKKRIQPRQIQLIVRNDKELSKLLRSVTIPGGGVLPNIYPNLSHK
ncbi:histone H2AX-like [Dioscorea cayenensis subsp. rotundata]|uniref:Histone H2AX-like n=1 Tax=Dioscorea cayennensis subsp. rotundata TaxID=55577 RepID=A0AB40BPL1_DIOCR|nr:histone H2AX-like [Dioscorea cayenensis subsp. rotundata]